jgi:hypothetical protein
MGESALRLGVITVFFTMSQKTRESPPDIEAYYRVLPEELADAQAEG